MNLFENLQLMKEANENNINDYIDTDEHMITINMYFYLESIVEPQEDESQTKIDKREEKAINKLEKELSKFNLRLNKSSIAYPDYESQDDGYGDIIGDMNKINEFLNSNFAKQYSIEEL